MEYCSLLQEDKWKVKCMAILKRDHCTCQDCHKRGIHNTYFPFNSIEELDDIFSNSLFNDMKLSSYLCGCDWNSSLKTPIRVSSKLIENNIYFSSFDDGGILNTYHLITDYEILTFHYRKSKNENIQIRHNGKKIEGRIIAFSFEENLFNSNYIEIKHFVGNTLLETLEINLLYNNKLYSLYFSHLRYIDKKPLFNFIPLHIHHQYYIKDRNPWEYEDDALVTLCADCHQKRHNTTNIPMYSTNGELLKSNLQLCNRCQGRGYIPQYHYYYEGICFQCYGEGVSEL